MNAEPFIFTFPLEEFDLAKLPVDSAVLRADRGLLAESVSCYFTKQFQRLGGEAQVAVRDDAVSVRWLPKSGLSGLVETGVAFLQKGETEMGIAFLRIALDRDPDNSTVLFNLGMAFSDRGKLPEALALLGKTTVMEPANARAWTALGVARFRNGQPAEAEQALRRGVELNAEDGYAHRNLGGLLMARDPQAGLRHLKRAAELLPDDQAAHYNLGGAYLQSGDLAAADRAFARAIEIAPLTDVAEQARTARTKIAHQNMRQAGGGAPRMDAVMYCLAAMKHFAEHPDALKPVTFEIALLGRGGLDINDPAQQYALKSMVGHFSGLQLVAYMYVGLKQLDPDADAGIDLSKEYEMAKQLQGEK